MSSSTPAVREVRDDSLDCFGPSAERGDGTLDEEETDRPMRDWRLRSLPRATMTATTVLTIAKIVRDLGEVVVLAREPGGAARINAIEEAVDDKQERLRTA